MKVALVTGSRRGIGLGIAKALHSLDYFVVLSATVTEQSFNAHHESLEDDSYINTAYIKCDISDREDREYLFNKIITDYGRLDLVVNNAGVAPEIRMDILETTEESVDRLLDINLKGTFFMCQLAAKHMIKLQQNDIFDYAPRIVNISSISAYTSSPNRGEYCMSKAGVSMVTLLFADKLAEYGIGVFEVRPGIILTDMTLSVREKYEKLISDGITPIKRFGYPKDVANCVLAIANGFLDFATGQVLNADGGFHIRRL
jgi:Dehydrogenases with different specificities (related to short-chain alcohol dehydrogenases)